MFDSKIIERAAEYLTKREVDTITIGTSAMFHLMRVGSDKAIFDRPESKFGIPNLKILFALISDFDPFDCRSGSRRDKLY